MLRRPAFAFQRLGHALALKPLQRRHRPHLNDMPDSLQLVLMGLVGTQVGAHQAFPEFPVVGHPAADEPGSPDPPLPKVVCK